MIIFAAKIYDVLLVKSLTVTILVTVSYVKIFSTIYKQSYYIDG